MTPFSLTCSYCDRPAMSFKPGTAPRVECGIMIDRGEIGERRCANLVLSKNCMGQRDLFLAVAS